MKTAVLTALLTVLLLAGPAGAQERACRGQIGPPKPPRSAERERLDGYVAHRKIFGFRTDLRYVRALVRSGGPWDEFLDMPVTRREQRYIRLRDRLDLGPAAERYLRERRVVYGGRSIEDGWPGDPYLLVRVTRDVAAHRAALRRLARYPERLRVRRTALSEGELDRLQQRIFRDDKRLEAEGFFVSSTGQRDGLVQVDVITGRSDFARFFARRYGPSVRVERIAKQTHVVGCSQADAFSVEADGRALRVHWRTGGSARLERLELIEHPDRVEIGIVERSYTGANTADLRFESTAATLGAPLGDRAVVDAATGLRLRLRGPLPGAPPCPPAEPVPSIEIEDDTERLYPPRAVDRYLLAHADEYGGFSVDGGTAVYRFTRNRERHERALKRLVPDPARLRTADAIHTVDELSDLAARIVYEAQLGGGFLDGYGAFLVAGAEPSRSDVIVTLVTARQDHAGYFAARYGSHVRTQVVGMRHECTVSDIESGA